MTYPFKYKLKLQRRTTTFTLAASFQRTPKCELFGEGPVLSPEGSRKIIKRIQPLQNIVKQVFKLAERMQSQSCKSSGPGFEFRDSL